MKIDNNFFPPHSPFSGSHQDVRHDKKEGIGHHLLEQTAAFYAWYMSWAPLPSLHSHTLEYLSRIMRIAQVSCMGGHYLTSAEEQAALRRLHNLQEELYNGTLSLDEIAGNLLSLLHSLTQINPKAKLVNHTIELEYLLCIRPVKETSPEVAQQYQQLLTHVVERIRPELPDLHAQAMAQGLSRVLENHRRIDDVYTALNDAIKGWL